MTNFELEAELLAEDFKSMLVNWGMHSNDDRIPGMHASAILDKDFCTREQVLLQSLPEQGERPAWNSWDWKRAAIFENGWDLHRRWQRIFLKYGNVVYTAITPKQLASLPVSANAKIIGGKFCAPELDHTHYDAGLNLWFSPDAILWFGGVKRVVEIKGIKQESYLKLTDDLDQACEANETVHKAREQVNLYLHLLGLQEGVILIENKNTCDFKLWVIGYESERALSYLERAYHVLGRMDAIEKHGMSKLPTRVCSSIHDTRAKACPMRSACFCEQGAL